MHEKVQNNVGFRCAKDFRRVIEGFFAYIWPSIKWTVRSAVNDNFHIVDGGDNLRLGG
jgi:hypothetical protein